MNCCVCYENSDRLDCGHVLCLKCIKKVRTDLCPVCREELKGNFVTSELLKSIRRKMKKDKKNNESVLDISSLNSEINHFILEDFLRNISSEDLVNMYINFFGNLPSHYDFTIDDLIQDILNLT